MVQALISLGRAAQALIFAGITNTEGAPSFAHFAKGGNYKRVRNLILWRDKALCWLHRYPPLQKTQGRATLNTNGANKQSKAGPPGRTPTTLESPFTNRYSLLHTFTRQPDNIPNNRESNRQSAGSRN